MAQIEYSALSAWLYRNDVRIVHEGLDDGQMTDGLLLLIVFALGCAVGGLIVGMRP